jgi:hypothetical protein
VTSTTAQGCEMKPKMQVEDEPLHSLEPCRIV